jgi:hypothetical protein
LWHIDRGPHETRGPWVVDYYIWWNIWQHFVYFGFQWIRITNRSSNCTCQIPGYCHINFVSPLLHPPCLLSGFIIFSFFVPFIS